MRTVKKIAVVAMVVSACIMLALVLLEVRYRIFDNRRLSEIEDSSRQSSKKDNTSHIDAKEKRNSAINTQTDWPMFRGQQRLLGIAEGNLSDKLDFFWKYKTEGQIKASPVIVDGVVFVGSSDKNIYAIDANDGQKIWSYQTDDMIEATACVIEGAVYVGSSGGFLYAIDANNGSLNWKYETHEQILGAANWILSPDGQTIWILVGSYDNKLHCIDSTNGRAVWTYETDNYINGSPAVEGNIAVFGGCDAMIHVVSLIDGTMVKTIDSGSYIAASAAILDGQVYVGNYDDVFIRADIKTGDILWKYEESKAPLFSSPAIGADAVVLGSRDELVHCIARKDGKKLWTFQTLGEVDSSPVICGDKIIVGSQDGIIYMLRLADGTKVWSYEIGQAISSSPAVADGIVVIGCDDGYVYAFKANQ
jgi:outer membrane protein assembly factor BamB